MQPGFLGKPAREILIGTVFVMGILYILYSILWPILPQEKLRALPWLLLVAVGLASMGRVVWRGVGRGRRAGIGDGKTFPWRLPLPESLAQPIREILTQTILCMGAVFAVFAIVVPFMHAEPVRMNRWGPLVLLALVAMCWIGEQWIKKRRQSGGDGTGHTPAPRTAFR